MKPLFDENEHYTDEAMKLKDEFNNLIEDFVKKKCQQHKIMEVQLCCEHVLGLICTMEKFDKGYS